MILNRISTAIREQNWFAVILEFFIVIAGVVIGFQITAWNGERADRAREAAIIERLAEEFSITLETAEARTETAQSAVQSSEALLQLLAAQNWPAEFDQLATLVDGTRPFPGPPEAPSSFSELVATGDMNLIRNAELRRTLTEFATIRDYHIRDSELSRDVALHLGQVYWDFSELVAAARTSQASDLQARALEDIRRPELIAPLAAIYRQQQGIANMQSATLEAVQAVVLSLEAAE